MSFATAAPSLAADWSLPWQAGANAGITRGTGSHNDGWNGKSNAVDFAINAGTPVLAPVDSTIISVCQARGGNNHNAIYFSSPDGNYTLMHVRASGLYKGQSFQKGQQIGVVAADTPNDPRCAISTGPHLHINFPNRNLVVDGYRVADMRGGTYTSRNGQIQTQMPPRRDDNIRMVNFTGKASNNRINVRSAPSTSSNIVGSINPNTAISFDAWTHGTAVPDLWTNQPDRRWYRIAGTDNWVASAIVYGNAPGSER
ncbi:peptidoglycan DD-metalloendopeptidase family protein [Chamaesiphon sp. OTE_20_metabat_361]|uniref:peptidoglycan DD-metalloendopeptidase family protein n=3 Tax=unclassified Chamaesiphon TaxID=2620921 RepID=UPI00286CB3EA|nr:peptidoglycan DD-metalloendopeptidase family protein [Chamaesiphon sp. OTE_20_metabat_361]